MHTIKPLTAVTPAEVQALACAAAERGEPLDTANLFPIGTSQHTLFTNEWLARTFELEGCGASDAAGATFEDFEILVLDLPCHPAGQCIENMNPGLTHG